MSDLLIVPASGDLTPAKGTLIQTQSTTPYYPANFVPGNSSGPGYYHCYLRGPGSTPPAPAPHFTWTPPGTITFTTNDGGSVVDASDLATYGTFYEIDLTGVFYPPSEGPVVGIGWRFSGCSFDQALANSIYQCLMQPWTGASPRDLIWVWEYQTGFAFNMPGFSPSLAVNHTWNFYIGSGGNLYIQDNWYSPGFWYPPGYVQFNNAPVGPDLGQLFRDNGNIIYLGVVANSYVQRWQSVYSLDGVNYTVVSSGDLSKVGVTPDNPAFVDNINISDTHFTVAINPTCNPATFPGNVVPMTNTLDTLRLWRLNGLVDVLAKEHVAGWVQAPPTTVFHYPNPASPPPPAGGFTDIVNRAMTGWPLHGISYSQSSTANPSPSPPYIDGYRADCSGFASMAAGIPRPGPNTVGFVSEGWITQIAWSQLRAGDFVGHCGPGTGGDAGHIMVCTSVNTGANQYTVYEQNGAGDGPNVNTYTIGNGPGGLTYAPYRLSTLL